MKGICHTIAGLKRKGSCAKDVGNIKELRAAPCQQPARKRGLSPTTTETEFCQQLKYRTCRSRFFPRSLRQELDGQHLDFDLVRFYAENSVELTQTSDLQKCELISKCYFKQLSL